MKRFFSLLLAAALILTLTGCSLLSPKETEAPTEPTEAEILLETKADERPYLGQTLEVSSGLEETAPAAQVLIQAGSVFEAKTGCAVNFIWQASEQAAGEKVSCSPSLTGIYYNLDVFEACGMTGLPGTWDEFIRLCDYLKNAGYQPLAINSEDAALTFEILLLPLLGTMDSIAVWEENEQAVDALQKLADFAAAGYLVMADAPAGQDKLARSNAVMTVGTLESCRQIGERSFMDISWGVMPMFGGFADFDMLAIQGSSEAVADFEAFVTCGAFDQLRADVTGGIPRDPNNADVLPGGIEAMQNSVTRGAAATEEFQALCLEFWNGKFTDGLLFAAALDDLAVN